LFSFFCFLRFENRPGPKTENRKPKTCAHRMATLLIIFAKEPVPGQVKNRLSPPLSPESAARLYFHFLQDVLEEMLRLTQVHLAMAYAPAPSRSFFAQVVPTRLRLVPQVEGDLGERLIQAFEWGFSLGYEAVLIRNSDSPDLPGALVMEAHEALITGGADVVLGPCPDGGYYLMGLKASRPELFRGVDWSTAAVLDQTLEKVRQLKLTAHLLKAWPDIDTLAELANFLQRSLSPPAPGWRSHAWASQHLRQSLPEISAGKVKR
jgi:rSAM/selenodomain-associated transferase 1